MRLFDQAHSYKTPANALKNFEKACEPIENSETIRHMVSVNSEGRYFVAVFLCSEHHHLMHYFMNKNVAVMFN